MLKVNLLHARPVQAESEIQEIKESDILTDESFLNQESEEAPPVIPETPEEPVVKEAPEKDVPETTGELQKEEDQPEFEFKPKSKFPVVPILVVLLLIVAVAGYFWVSKKPGKAGKTPGAKKQTVAVKPSSNKQTGQKASPSKSTAETPSAAEAQAGKTAESTSTAPAPVPVEVKAQRQAGVQAVNMFGKVLSSVPRGTSIGFLSFDGNAFTLELFANSQARLNQFLQNAKSAIPALHYKVLAKDRAYYQGRTVPHLLLSGQLSASGTAEPGVTTLTSGTIRRSLRKLAASHGVRVRELRTGAPVTENGQKRVRVTLKVSGAQNAIQAFLKDLLKQYTNLGVSRLFVSAAKSGAAGQLDVAADLNVFLE